MLDILDKFLAVRESSVAMYRYGLGGVFEREGNSYVVSASNVGEEAYDLIAQGVYAFLDRGILPELARASSTRFKEIFDEVAPEIPFSLYTRKISLFELQRVLRDVSRREEEALQQFMQDNPTLS